MTTMRVETTGRFLRLPVDLSLPLEKQLELETASTAKRTYWRNRAKILEKSAIYRRKHKTEIRERERKRKYGVDDFFIQRLTLIQNGKCGICKKPLKLYTDHEHKKKVVRGFLCARCNVAIAFVEKTEWFKAAIDYLRSPPARFLQDLNGEVKR